MKHAAFGSIRAPREIPEPDRGGSHFTLRRDPLGYLAWHAMAFVAEAEDVARHWAGRLRIKRPSKVIYRKFPGDPVM